MDLEGFAAGDHKTVSVGNHIQWVAVPEGGGCFVIGEELYDKILSGGMGGGQTGWPVKGPWIPFPLKLVWFENQVAFI